MTTSDTSAPARSSTRSRAAARTSSPALCLGQAGQHAQPGQDLGGQTGQHGQVERAVLRGAAGRGDAGRLVEQPEGLGDAAAVGVRVDEEHVPTPGCDLRGEGRRDGRATRRTRRAPHGHDPAALGRGDGARARAAPGRTAGSLPPTRPACTPLAERHHGAANRSSRRPTWGRRPTLLHRRGPAPHARRPRHGRARHRRRRSAHARRDGRRRGRGASGPQARPAPCPSHRHAGPRRGPRHAHGRRRPRPPRHRHGRRCRTRPPAQPVLPRGAGPCARRAGEAVAARARRRRDAARRRRSPARAGGRRRRGRGLAGRTTRRRFCPTPASATATSSATSAHRRAIVTPGTRSSVVATGASQRGPSPVMTSVMRHRPPIRRPARGSAWRHRRRLRRAPAHVPSGRTAGQTSSRRHPARRSSSRRARLRRTR